MLSGAISPILSKVVTVGIERISMIIEVGKEVEALQINLRAIRAVLKDAGERQIKEETVRVWLDGLKDALYDIDSVLDEWTTFIEKSDIAETKQTSLFSCFLVRKTFHRHDIALKIRDLNRTIAAINAAKDRFGFFSTASAGNVNDEPQWRNTTTSSVDAPVVYGQDRHKGALVDLLTSAEGEVRFVPVVGMGGIGKTTLAKHVYNDEDVRAVFGGCRAWICVTNTFDSSRIAGEIIEKLTGEARSEEPVERLGELVRGRRFLLVLDDVWTTNYHRDWEPLEKALTNGAAVGSRVLVTTRKEEVARMVGEIYAIRLENLRDQDCWSLMREIAFSGRNEEDRQYLEETGMEIARRCDGLPLAAKTLAGLLRVKASKEEWLRVLHSDLWELENVEEKVFRPLFLSYYDLSDLERCCFSYCAILAKDHEIHKDDLVQQWMSQRYFMSSDDNGGDKQEEIGRRCFDNLAARSFFQDFEYDDVWNKRVKSCKMHDVVHDFALFLAKNECSNIQVNNGGKNRVDLIARHVHLTNRSAEEFPITSSSPRRLHTLMISSPPNSFLSDRLSDFECLRTLSLTRDSSFELPSGIGKLIHLRYLSLIAFCFQIKLPATIGDLFNLQTLKIVASVTLPDEMEKLINLRHLCAPYATGPKSWPKAIGKLRNLKTVERICPDRNEEAFQLQDLGNLRNLRYIYLKELGVDQKQVEGAKRVMLCDNPRLVKLVLDFRQADSESDESKIHTNVLEALEPHRNLRFLVVGNYSGLVFPSWTISRIHLEMLVLKTCLQCETLPALGKLPCLEFLAISHLISLKKLGPEFLGIESGDFDSRVSDTLFPKLKVLVIEEAQSLREFVGVRNWEPNGTLKIMPCLREMIICWCPELKSLPDFLETTKLNRLVIEGCQGLEESRKETGTDWPKIRHVPNIQNSDSGEWKQKYIPRAWTGSGYSNKSLRRRTISD